MKKLYCFDFDGTLTCKDTLFLFLKFCNARKYYAALLLFGALFVLVKLKLASAEKVKRQLIAFVLKGTSQEWLEQRAQAFFKRYHREIMRPRALDFIAKLEAESSLCLVTASLDIWVQPFAQNLGALCIATQAEFSQGVYTGRFLTKNCNGAEKVHRITQAVDLSQFDKTIAFGDTSGDKQMLAWADEAYFRFFQ